MSERLPSLDVLLDLNQGERDKQLAHFDALDSKAGIVLGFAGVLIALSGNVNGWWGLGLAAAVVASGAAVAAFWPRRYPVLLPSAIGEYVAVEEVFTKLTVFDTLENMINETTDLLELKARRLKFALISLAAAATLYGGGVLAA